MLKKILLKGSSWDRIEEREGYFTGQLHIRLRAAVMEHYVLFI